MRERCAACPIALLEEPVVREYCASCPSALLEEPVVRERCAELPIALLEEPADRRSDDPGEAEGPAGVTLRTTTSCSVAVHVPPPMVSACAPNQYDWIGIGVVAWDDMSATTDPSCTCTPDPFVAVLVRSMW